jgi:hypothetical protein
MMKLPATLAAALTAFLCATVAYAGGTLPASVTLQDYLAIVAKAGGSTDGAYAVTEHWYGPGFANRGHAADVLLAQKENEGQSIEQVIAGYAGYAVDFCDKWPYRAAVTTLGERLELGGLTLLRGSFDCIVLSNAVHEEYVVVMDALRHQVWSLAGETKDIARLRRVAAALFEALGGAYR